MHAVRTAKFVARKQWIVTGSDDMYIRVYNYNTMDKVKAFEAHTDYIRQAPSQEPFQCHSVCLNPSVLLQGCSLEQSLLPRAHSSSASLLTAAISM